MAKLDLEVLAEELAEKVLPNFKLRLAWERAEGFREGVEAAAQWLMVMRRDLRPGPPEAHLRGEASRLPPGPCKCGAIFLSEGKSFLPAGQAHSRAACQPEPTEPR